MESLACQQIAWPTTSSAGVRNARGHEIQVSADRLADDFVGFAGLQAVFDFILVSADRLADDFVGARNDLSRGPVHRCQQIAWPTTSSASASGSQANRSRWCQQIAWPTTSSAPRRIASCSTSAGVSRSLGRRLRRLSATDIDKYPYTGVSRSLGRRLRRQRRPRSDARDGLVSADRLADDFVGLRRNRRFSDHIRVSRSLGRRLRRRKRTMAG